jgi:hypothetical protein
VISVRYRWTGRRHNGILHRATPPGDPESSGQKAHPALTKSAADSIFFLRGQLRFSDGEQAAPFPSALVIWGGTPELITGVREVLPEAWHVH